MNNERICGLLVAAGLSTRMKAFKPLMPFRGRTVIENSVESLLSGGAERAVVVTGHRAEELEALLSDRFGERVLTVRNPDYAVTDMLRSIQTGCTALPRCDAFFLLPGDMPAVRPSTFHRLLEVRDGAKSVIFPTLAGRRKHPPLIDARVIPDILSFHGEGGLRGLWQEQGGLIREVPVDDEGVWADLDTPEDYEKYKKQFE